MIRAYLDWNVFHDFKKDPSSSRLYEKIIASKLSVDYYFSEGLIADLKNDKSEDIKRLYKELKVVESIAGDKLLNVTKTNDFPLMKRSPVEAYETYFEYKFDEILDIFDDLVSNMNESASEKELEVLEIPFDVDVPEFITPQKGKKKKNPPKKELILKKVSKTFLEHFRDILKGISELEKSNDNFKALRRALVNNDSPKITKSNFF